MRLSSALTQAWPQHRSRVTMGAIGSLTLGLAPFFPHAHIYKQLVRLFEQRPAEPLDTVDLVLHGAPWVFLVVSLAAWAIDAARRARSS